MNPIARPTNSKVVTLRIDKGPNMHGIGASLCYADQEHWLLGIYFEISLPCEWETSHKGTSDSLLIHLIPVKFELINDERITLGAYRKDDDLNFGSGIGMWTPRLPAPFQLTNYSTKTRSGYMEVSYDLYCSLVSEL